MLLEFEKWWQWSRWVGRAEMGKVMYGGTLCWVLKSGLVPVDMRRGLS